MNRNPDPPAKAAAPESPFDEALRTLPTMIRHCGCPDRWHLLWAGLKAQGMLRAMHGQTTLLRAMLADRWVRGGRVMIAGAADTASLDILAGLFDDHDARYTVIDPCEAPLRLVSERAAVAGLRVDPRRGLAQDIVAEAPWDLVFIHYTLGFLDHTARSRLFARIAADLAPDGVVLCGIRYRARPPDDDPAALSRWIETTAGNLRTCWQAHPDLLAPMLAHLDDYAANRHQRELVMPAPDTVIAECRAAGLEVLESHDNPATPNPRELGGPGGIAARILLLSRPGRVA